jgi:hypothetical protein
MVGGAIAIAILDLLVKKRVLTIDDVKSALRKAQGSLGDAPAGAVAGASDGARIIGEITEQYDRRRRRTRRPF